MDPLQQDFLKHYYTASCLESKNKVPKNIPGKFLWNISLFQNTEKAESNTMIFSFLVFPLQGLSIRNDPYFRSIPLLTCNHSLNITCYFSEHGMTSFSFLQNHWRYKSLNLKKKNPNIKMFSELTFSVVPFGSWASSERPSSQTPMCVPHSKVWVVKDP